MPGGGHGLLEIEGSAVDAVRIALPDVFAGAAMPVEDGWQDYGRGSLHHHRLSGRGDCCSRPDAPRRRTQDDQQEEGQ